MGGRRVILPWRSLSSKGEVRVRKEPLTGHDTVLTEWNCFRPRPSDGLRVLVPGTVLGPHLKEGPEITFSTNVPLPLGRSRKSNFSSNG